jgi:mRNA interferase MazF
MKRGDIYFIKSTHQEEGCEMHANRPAVIVSNDANNEHSELVQVCYLTTAPKRDLPTHVLTQSCLRPSTIIAEQITTVSKTRVAERIGKITPDEQADLDNALAISIGIDCPHTEKASDPTSAKDILNSATKQALMDGTKIVVERDIYKKHYEDLLEVLKGRAHG